MLVLGGLTGVILGATIVGILSHVVPHKMSVFEQERTDIITSGSGDFSKTQDYLFFVLGDATTKPCYRFYIRTANGERKLKELPVTDVAVCEEEGSIAYLAEQHESPVYPRWFDIWVLPKIIYSDKFSELKVIHVPKGTIKIGRRPKPK